jgi:ketosteroid isomerase-like protein
MIGAILAKQAVNSGFAALNQQDLAGFMKGWADDGAFIFPGALSVSGKFVGKPAVQGWFEKFLHQFPKTQFTVRNIFVATSLR